MSSRKPVTDEELSEYVDGGLSEERRAEVAAWLLENPKKAAEVERLRQLTDALRGLGAEILDEPVPERLREVVRRARSGGGSGKPEADDQSAGERPSRRRSGSGTVEMVAACAIFALGGGLGWGAHQTLVEAKPFGPERPLTDAREHAPARQGVPLRG